MAGEASTAGAVKMLDALTGRATQTAQTTYLGLLSAAPSDAGGGTELTAGNGYARQSVAWTAPTGDPSSTENTSLITFGPFTSDFAQVGWVALYDASTAGNMLAWWAVDTAKDPANGDSITVAAGALVMTAD